MKVVRMDGALDIGRSQFEASGIDAENLILAFVPQAIAVNPVPIPRAHLARGDRERPALFALPQPGVRFLEFRGAGANPILEFDVELLQLARLAIEFREYLDLGAQHLRRD